jgi:hypothetical protein
MLAAAFKLAVKGLLIGVNVHMLCPVLLAGKAFRAIIALKVAHVEMLGVDVPLQVELGVIASRAVSVKAGELVIIHLSPSHSLQTRRVLRSEPRI